MKLCTSKTNKSLLKFPVFFSNCFSVNRKLAIDGGRPLDGKRKVTCASLGKELQFKDVYS